MKINQPYIALVVGLIIGLDSFLWASPKHFIVISDTTSNSSAVDTAVMARQKSNQTLFQQYFSKSVKRDTIFLDINEDKSVEVPSTASATMFAATIDAGRTAADIDVTSSGGLSYSIPFDLPPGINGVVPQVGLAYTSQGGNGIAGYGWNIVGMSAISRVAAVPYIDGYIGNINFDLNDRFALDGQRLLLKSGVYGADGAEYQTENYSNIRIISRGVSPYGASYGPAYFEVHHADGSRLLYGYTNDSRSRTTYALVASDTPQDIRINYVYSITDNVMHLDEINYGSKSSALNINKVQFTYSTPTRRENMYIGGQSFTQNKILSKVTVVGNGTPLRHYIPTYGEITSLNYQRINSIQEFNGDETRALAPINFSYQSTSNTLVHHALDLSLGVSNVESNNSKILTFDFTGNGNMDFILYPNSKDKFYLYYSLDFGSSFNIPLDITTGLFEEIFQTQYLNYADKLITNSGIGLVQNTTPDDYVFKIFGHTGSSPVILQYEKEWNDVPKRPGYYSECDGLFHEGPSQRFKFLSGDFNGDGLTEVFAFSYSEEIIGYDVYNPDPPSEDEYCEKFYYTAPTNVYRINLDRRLTSGYVNMLPSFPKLVFNENQLYTGDFNGDGKMDVLFIQTGSMTAYTLNHDGSDFIQIGGITDSRIVLNNQIPILLGDYNGDGKMDIMFSTGYNNIFTTFISTGAGFIKHEGAQSFSNVINSVSTIFQQNFLLTNDFDGDGITDVLYSRVETKNTLPGKIIIEVHRNNNISTSLSPQFTKQTFSEVTTNIRHFPIPLLLSINKENPNLQFGFFSDKYAQIFNFQKDIHKEKGIVSVNQDGVIHNIEYAPLLNGEPNESISLYASSGAQAYPNLSIEYAPSLRVVKKIEKHFEFSLLKKIFGYKNAVTRVDGLGFLGFEETIQTNWHSIFASDPNRKFIISIQDQTLRGATIKTFLTKNSIISPAIKSVNLTNPPSASGISDGATLADYISRYDIVYSTTILANKTFINVPAASAEKNMLHGTFGTTSLQYDAYYNPIKTTNNINGQSTQVTTSTFENYVGGQYYIGRPLSSQVVMTQGSETFSTKESYSYSGNLPVYIYREGNFTNIITDHLTYDSFGNVVVRVTSTPGVPNRNESMLYDVTGRFMTQYTNPDGLITTSTYNAQTGNVLTNTDPYGRISTYGYDTWGNQISIKDFLNNTTTISYARSGSDIVSTASRPDGSVKITTTNALGKKAEVREKTISGAYLGQRWTYDIYGRLNGESAPSTTGTYSQWNTTYYDNYDRVSQVTGYSGKIVNYTYSGLSTISNDGVKTITTVRNGLDQVASVTDPGGTVNYAYFPNGNLKTTNYGGSIQTIEQNGWGEKTKLIDPSAGEYTYAYDGWGQLTSETTPKGTTIFAYDAAGKITSKSLIGSATNMSWTYTYNPTTKLPTQTTLVNADGNNTTSTYSYDSYKRLSGTTEDNPYATFSHAMTYDSYGRMGTETMQATDKSSSKTASRSIAHSYQNGDLLETSLIGTGQTLWRFLGMDTKGMITSYRQGSTIQTTLQYDAVGYPQQIKVDRAGGSPTTLMTLGYAFNTSRGFPNTRSNSMFSWNESFSYDNLDRLTVFNDNNGSHNQSYDLRGRITSNSRLGSYGYTGTSYQQLDLDLNLVADTYYQAREVQDINYTAFKSPATIHEAGHDRYGFQYNSILQRANMFYGGEQTDPLLRPKRKHYSEDGSMEIHKDLVTGKTSFVFYLGGDAYSAPALWKEIHSASPTTQDLYYLHRDHLGSIVLINDALGNPVEKRQFDAWGNIVKLTDGSGTNIPIFVVTDRGFTSHEHLQSVGLIHMNARLYDPLLGRFLSPDNYVQDPFSTQNFNRYGYAMNNPLVYTDPSGEVAWYVPVIIGAVVGAYFGGSTANRTFNPFRWDYNSGTTWKGIGTGAVIGGVSGAGWAFGLAALSGSSLIGGGTLISGLSVGGLTKGIAWGVLATKAISTVTTAASMFSDFDKANRILAGKYYSNENESFGAQLLLGLSRTIWESPQSWVGYNYTQMRNIGSYIDRIDYFDGATFATSFNRGEKGISLGNYLNVWTREEMDQPFSTWILRQAVFMHEYGHTFDSRKYGLYYLIGIGIPSFRDKDWTEWRANRHAARYFGRYYGVNWDQFEKEYQRR